MAVVVSNMNKEGPDLVFLVVLGGWETMLVKMMMILTKTLNLIWEDEVGQQGKKMMLFALGIIQRLPDPGLANVKGDC